MSSLEGMGPRRLAALLAHHGDARAAGGRGGGRGPASGPSWLARGPRRLAGGGHLARSGRSSRPRQVLDGPRRSRHRGAPGRPRRVPVDLRRRSRAPTVLFHRGDPDVAVGARVAIVGTRDCTRYGYDLAFELGRDLSAVGVSIVSGLALGIDGAAHAGASTPEPPAGGGGRQRARRDRPASPLRPVARGVPTWRHLVRVPLGLRRPGLALPARNRLIGRWPTWWWWSSHTARVAPC